MKLFNGKDKALERLVELEKKVRELKNKGITPKLVSIMAGEDPGSQLYLSLKKKAAESVGVDFEVIRFRSNATMVRIMAAINKLNGDKSVQGVMIQLPLPGNLRLPTSLKLRRTGKTGNLINVIDQEKDVDGMRDDSPFIAPVVKAVVCAIKEAGNYMAPFDKLRVNLSLKAKPCKVVVVGATGFVGLKIVKVLEEMDYDVAGLNSKAKNLKLEIKRADVLISATGSENIIKAGMVKLGSILIDVGSPRGDIEKKAYDKASFVSPVPGGIGPLTIYYLIENLVKATGAQSDKKSKI